MGRAWGECLRSYTAFSGLPHPFGALSRSRAAIESSQAEIASGPLCVPGTRFVGSGLVLFVSRRKGSYRSLRDGQFQWIGRGVSAMLTIIADTKSRMACG